ncbi:ricin-type beta-trefoil lectin domain protein [Streptomyces sp. YIM S03343]
MATPLSPRSPRSVFPPPDGGLPWESDELLAARLRSGPDGEVTHSTAALIARHWQPVRDYAAICLASSAGTADMVTAAAFHQVFDRLTLGEPGAALRPRLLLTARDLVRFWAADDLMSGMLPELGNPAGARGLRTVKSPTPENRELAERAFHGLTPTARCLLWHTEVEGEPISVPAALLGLDTATAVITLEQTREQFREGCVRAHRELAPTKECRFHNRLLDVPLRRGGELLPEVRRHLDACPYCRYAAEQLSHFEAGLGALLAEAVLGWGADRYLASRPGRTARRSRTGPAPARSAGRPRRAGGGRHRHRALPRILVPAEALRSPRALLAGVGIASAGLLATVLALSLWPDGGSGPAPAPSAGATDGHGTASPSTPTANATTGRTRLRESAAGLCLGIRGKPETGADATLAVCSSAATQQWSYERDGLLRSAAAPGLCLDSHADAGVIILGRCAPAKAARGDDVRYDLTARGEFLPRWTRDLALTSASARPDAPIVTRVRDGSPAQRWQTVRVPAAG